MLYSPDRKAVKNMQERKTVLVTGSSRGIGRAIALAFGRAGYRVVLNASKSRAELEDTQRLLEQENIPVLAFLRDVSDYQNCRAVFQSIAEQWGSVDVQKRLNILDILMFLSIMQGFPISGFFQIWLPPNGNISLPSIWNPP